jgi:NitT/TauT family transport system substrate-binding protein
MGKGIVRGLLGALMVALTQSAVQAADAFTVAITAPYGWDSAVVGYGNRLGFYAEKDLQVQVAATDAVAQNLQAVIAGSADIGIVSMPIFIAAAMQGAPVKMIASAFKGAPDFLWYVRSDSKIRSFKDVTDKTSIGITAPGSTSFILAHAFLDQYNLKANFVPVAAGTGAAMTQIMTGQIDIASDGNGLLGVPEFQRGEVRTIAYGSDLAFMNNVTVRGFIVRSDTLAKRRDALVRFLMVYQKTADWMYRDPRALEWFAEGTQSTLDEATRVRNNSYPEGHLNVEDITGVDITVKQSLDYKRIDRAPTPQELAGMFDTIWKRDMK